MISLLCLHFESYEGDFLLSTRSPVSPGLMLEAGGETFPIQVDAGSERDGVRLLLRASQDMRISLCYCSLYRECFRSELFKRPEATDSCEAAEKLFISHGFFRN